jgi:hypothetical protein
VMNSLTTQPPQQCYSTERPQPEGERCSQSGQAEV